MLEQKFQLINGNMSTKIIFVTSEYAFKWLQIT